MSGLSFYTFGCLTLDDYFFRGTGGCSQKGRNMMDEIEKANLKELSQYYKASYNEVVMLNKEDDK
jgi:hypothetical protein